MNQFENDIINDIRRFLKFFTQARNELREQHSRYKWMVVVGGGGEEGGKGQGRDEKTVEDNLERWHSIMQLSE